MSDASSSSEKILEKSPLNGIAVPVAIVLVGAFIIFGVTKMLSTERSHRDLIQEMHSKTFGNRWVAAYELSKLFAANAIDESEIPWVIENLSAIYDSSQDPRSRNFIVIAIGSLQKMEGLSLLNKALSDQDDKVKFNAIVAIGNMPVGTPVNWQKLEEFLTSADTGLQHAAILALAQHKIEGADQKIKNLLGSPEQTIRYAAAIGLINYRKVEIERVLKEIMALDYNWKKSPGEKGLGLNGVQVEALKMNVLIALQKNKWAQFNELLNDVAQNDKNVKIATKAKEVLNLLKN